MDTLNTVLASLSQVRTNKNNAKDRWLTAMQEGSDDQAQLKQEFHQADNVWTGAAETLAKAIVDLQTIFCYELALQLLDTEETYNLHKMVAELQLDNLTDPYQRLSFPTLAANWYRAEGMREAAQTLQKRYDNRGEGETIETILAEVDSARKPQSWSYMVQAFTFIRNAVKGQNPDDSEDEVNATSVLFLNRHQLRQYDDVVEKLSDKLEDIYYGGNLSSVLSQLDDVDVSRALQDAVTGGLIRARQPQAEEKRETRGVTVAERTEEDEDGEPEE